MTDKARSHEDQSIIASFKIDPPKIPCSQEEKETYGVDFKKNSSRHGRTVLVQKEKFEDNRKLFYRVIIGGLYTCEPPYHYSTKEKALEAAKNAVENLRKKAEEND